MSFYPYNYIGPVVEQAAGPSPTPTIHDDFLEWGIDWFTEFSQQHASQTVVVSWLESGVTFTKELQASLVDEEGRILRGAVKASMEYTYFLFNKEDIDTNSVPLERGVYITWNSAQYEIVLGRNRNKSSNDTYQRTIIVGTKHVLN